MSTTEELVTARIRQLRRDAAHTTSQVAAAAGLSVYDYERTEAGTRALKGDELILLADHYGMRTSAVLGVIEVRERAQVHQCTDERTPGQDKILEHLYAYLELDQYLTDNGI